jgi:hypothetical protein
MCRKVYVGVEAVFSPEGRLMPRAILWPDGRRFPIDRVLEIRRAPSLKAGGAGVRYRCRIQHQERYLFLEEDQRWFVEQEMP